MVLRHGYIAQEVDAQWQWFAAVSVEPAELDTLLDDADPDVMIFASSVNDFTALSLARRAQARGVKVVHVLDNWSAYLSRMATDGLPAFSPDVYAVMDTLAAESAVAAGISSSAVQVTGQPGLSDNAQARSPPKARRSQRVDTNKKIVFVSEPIGSDQGSTDQPNSYRGYTEAEVLQLLCRALQPVADQIFLSILPHPREDEVKLTGIWEKYRRAVQGAVLPKGSTSVPVTAFDGVVGMASILLYEAWLSGRPTLSLQPGLQQHALRQIGLRPGVLLIDLPEGAEEKIQTWVEVLKIDLPVEIRDEAKAHARAPQNVLSLALGLAANREPHAK